MSVTLCIAALWLGFGASHVLLSSQSLRPKLVAKLGEPGFLGVYSLVAFAFFVPLMWEYFNNRHAGDWLWITNMGLIMRWTLYVLMGAAFVLVVAGLLTPSATMIGAKNVSVRGVHRITRHPLFMGLGIFGLLHLVPKSTSADFAFFVGFPLFALLGCWHQDRRKLASQPDYRAYYDATPFLPFTGRETLQGIRELSPLAIVVGVGLTIGLRLLHGPLFFE